MFLPLYLDDLIKELSNEDHSKRSRAIDELKNYDLKNSKEILSVLIDSLFKETKHQIKKKIVHILGNLIHKCNIYKI